MLKVAELLKLYMELIEVMSPELAIDFISKKYGVKKFEIKLIVYTK